MTKSTRTAISISNLLINSENPRFDPVSNQKEAIQVMLEKEGSRIKKLTTDITTNGISPLESFATVSKKGKYLTLEGNRRIVVLKLLNDPKITNDQKFREFFIKMKDKASVRIPSSVSCTVFENEDDAHHWIRLKHTGQNKGAGTVPWDPVQQDRFLKKSSRKIQVFEFAQENGIESKDVEATNLDRLISTPYVCTKIGISFPKGELKLKKSKSEVKANIKKVFDKISENKFKVGNIYTSVQRKSWINQVIETKKGKKDGTNTITMSTSSSDTSHGSSGDSITSEDTPKGPPKSPNRRHLIPDNCELILPDGKINDIFRELKEDLILDGSRKSTPNAIGVLFRVFLELSLVHYIDKKRIADSKKLAKKVKFAYKKELTISEKIDLVADFMEKKKIADVNQLKGIRRLSHSTNDVLNIISFHEFVHSPSVFPEDLKSKWSNLQSFFEILWNDLSKKGK